MDTKTILLVEDEAILAMTEKISLANEGFKVLHVLSGEKAVQTVKSSPEQIDLILMDIDLGPGRMDGTAAAREILKEHDIPILFLSAHTEPEVVNKTEQITSYGYVIKGSDSSVLLASIRMAFKLNSAYRHLHAKEKALTENQRKLRRAELVARAGNWEIRAGSEVMTASEGAASIFGFKGLEWKFSEIEEITLPEYLPLLEKVFRSLLEHGTPFEVEFKIRKKDTGEIIDILAIAGFNKEENTVFGIIQDITQRKLTESILRLNEKKYRYLFEHNPLPMWIYDIKSLEFLEVNEAAIRHYGYSKGEFQEMSLTDTCPAEDCDKVKTYASSLTGELDRSDTWRHKKKSGEVIFVEMISHFIDYEDRDARLVLINDVTESKLTEIALQRSESEYRSLFESANDAIVIFEPEDEIILDANNKACALYGYSKDELIGLSLKKLSKYVQLGEEQINKTLKTGSYEQFETEQYRKDGSIIHFLINASVVEYNGIKAILSINHDITGRRRAEETVKLLSHSVKSVTQGISITDLDNKILFVNQAFTNYYGYTEEEIKGKHITILRSDGGIDYRLVQKETLTGGWQGELINRKKDGTLFPIYLTTSVVYDDKARPLALVGVMTDITERKQAEKEMQEKNRNLEFLNSLAFKLAELPSGADLSGFLIKELRTFTGAVLVANSEYDPEQKALITRHIEADQFFIKAALKIGGNSILNTVSPVSREMYDKMVEHQVGFMNTFTEVSFGAIPERVDKAIRAITGINRLWAIVYVMAGEIFGSSLLGFKENQPEPSEDMLKSFAHLAAVSLRRKKAEEEIRQINDKLTELNAAKDKLFSIIAHDLRGPFSGFIGLTEALANDPESFKKEEISTIGSTMNSTAKKLFELLNNLLQWSRLQTGRMDFSPERFNFAFEADSIIKLFSSAASVKLISLYNNAGPDTDVYFDRNIVSAILRNLLSNAVKFTPTGGRVTINSIKKGNLLEVRVSDTGIGMTEEVIGKVFRIDSGYTTRGTNNEEGSGLGLVLCKELIEKSGGKIKVNSTPGKGTDFVFTLPVA